MSEDSVDKPQSLWHPMMSGAVAMAMVAGFALGGYKLGVEHAKVIDVPGPVQYVDVPGPARIVKEPYEVRVEVPVSGPEVYIPVPGPVVVKKIVVSRPQYCPKQQSVAAALNEYEALLRK
jgi:hypothetical protein